MVERAPASKHSKKSVGYSKGMKAPGDRCAACVHFQPPHACERVEGMINADMWCRLFKRKS